MRLLQISELDAAMRVVTTYYGEERIPAKTRYFVEQLCNEL
jgi:hypothetical protein